MPDVLVRDLDPTTITRLKELAGANGRSLQSEVKEILTEASLFADKLSELQIARRIKASLKNRVHTDSAALLREDRDR